MPRQTLKQRPDGRYRCKYKGVEFYGDTQSEALAKRDEYKRTITSGNVKKKDQRLYEYAVKWVSIYRAESSRAMYNQYVRSLNRFCAHFDKNPLLSEITKTDVVSYYNTMTGRSKSFISKEKMAIRGMFSDAVDDGIIPVNPATSAKAPKGTEGSHRAIEPWERELVHQMVDHRFGVAAMLMLYGGLRRGEVLAFDIDRDVDFEHGRIYVRESVSFSNSIRGDIKSAKTVAGTRDIPLFNPLMDILQGRHGLAVSSESGNRLTLSAFDRVWQSYLSKMSDLHNGFSRRWAGEREYIPVTIRTHDFRHSFCTMCCDAHVPIEVLISWMGHADEKMIREVYDHLTDFRKLEAEKSAAVMVQKLCPRGQNGGQL